MSASGGPSGEALAALPELERGLTGMLTKAASEGTLIAEAMLARNLTDRLIRVEQ